MFFFSYVMCVCVHLIHNCIRNAFCAFHSHISYVRYLLPAISCWNIQLTFFLIFFFLFVHHYHRHFSLSFSLFLYTRVCWLTFSRVLHMHKLQLYNITYILLKVCLCLVANICVLSGSHFNSDFVIFFFMSQFLICIAIGWLSFSCSMHSYNIYANVSIKQLRSLHKQEQKGEKFDEFCLYCVCSHVHSFGFVY